MTTILPPREPQEIIDYIIDITKGKDSIFRGESRDYSESAGTQPLTSNLYRQFCLPSKKKNAPLPIDNEYFSILNVERDIIEKAKAHLAYGATDVDVWTQLQHYGGKTALIDFTYNLHIALFFACEKNFDQDGKLFIFPSNDFPKKDDTERKQDILIIPTGKDPRVIFQSSVFVHAHKGYLKTKKLISIESNEKNKMLDYLRKIFNIHAGTIYNDIHGFIQNLENHSTAEIEFYRGLAYCDAGNYKEAINCYDKSIKLNANSATTYNNRGLAKFYSDDIKGSLSDYDKSIEIDPREPTTYYNRGNSKYNLSNPKEAILDYNKAIEINPQYALAYNNRASAKSISGDKEGAILDYNKAIEINTQEALAYYNRGSLKDNFGDKEGAKQDWLQARKLAVEQNFNELIKRIDEDLRKI